MSISQEKFKEMLKAKGLKVTNQRLLVLEVLAEHRDKHMTAEDIYAHWMQNIDAKYLTAVTQTVEAIKGGKKSETEYLWHHPQKGCIRIRFGGCPDETYQNGLRLRGWHYDIANESESQTPENRHEIPDAANEIIDAFYNVYSSIVEINLRTELAYILKSNTEELNQKVFSVNRLYHVIAERFVIGPEKNTVKQFFDIGRLKIIAEAQEHCSFDFQVKEEEHRFKWKRVEFLRVPRSKEKLYLVFSDVDEMHIIDSVLKQFVFDNNDYLYYVDIKNNSFLSFYKNNEKII